MKLDKADVAGTKTALEPKYAPFPLNVQFRRHRGWFCLFGDLNWGFF